MYARMAKLVDALALGASGRNTMGVQVPLLAPAYIKGIVGYKNWKRSFFIPLMVCYFAMVVLPVAHHNLVCQNATKLTRPVSSKSKRS